MKNNKKNIERQGDVEEFSEPEESCAGSWCHLQFGLEKFLSPIASYRHG